MALCRTVTNDNTDNREGNDMGELTEREELLKEVNKRKKRTALELGQLYIKNYVQHCKCMAGGQDDMDTYTQIRKTLNKKAASKTNDEQALYHYMSQTILDWQIKMHPYMQTNYMMGYYELRLFELRLQRINDSELRLREMQGKNEALNRIIEIVEGDKAGADLKQELLSVADSLRTGYGSSDYEQEDDSLSAYYPNEQGENYRLRHFGGRLKLIFEAIYYLKGFEKVIDLLIETFGCEDLAYFNPDIDGIITHIKDANIQFEFLRDHVESSGKDTDAAGEVLKVLSPLYERTHTEDGVTLDGLTPPQEHIDRARQIIQECRAFTAQGTGLDALMFYINFHL